MDGFWGKKNVLSKIFSKNFQNYFQDIFSYFQIRGIYIYNPKEIIYFTENRKFVREVDERIYIGLKI